MPFPSKNTHDIDTGARINEKNLSAEQYLAKKNPRISGPYVHQKRPSRHQEAPRQGSETAGGDDRHQVRPVVMPGFSRQERLRKRVDFLRLSHEGQKIHSANFIVLWKERPEPSVRLGVTVSGKVGNAVVRNRVKRLVREFYRLNKDLFAPVDYNIVAKQGAARLDFGEVSQELGRAVQRTKKQQC
jgi:ribonuclease P protein component